MIAVRRTLAAISGGLPVLGCLCLVLASSWYPGGTWWDPEALGASFVDTFLCDLMRQRGINGALNPVGGIFGRLGMALLVLSLIPTWWLAGSPRESPEAPAGDAEPPPTGTNPARTAPGARRTVATARASRALGLAGLVPLAVGLAIPGAWFHAVLIPVAGSMELAALTLLTGATFRQPGRRVIGGLGVASILVLVVGLGLYWPTMWFGQLSHRGLPGVQKLGVLTLVAWMVAIARDAWER